jgi:hypothetical protein
VVQELWQELHQAEYLPHSFELQFDRDAAAMAGIDPDTGRFVNEDRGTEDKGGDDKKNSADTAAVVADDGTAFTEEDARAFAEGKAYQIRQTPGKHYSRSVKKTDMQERR